MLSSVVMTYVCTIDKPHVVFGTIKIKILITFYTI